MRFPSSPAWPWSLWWAVPECSCPCVSESSPSPPCRLPLQLWRLAAPGSPWCTAADCCTPCRPPRSHGTWDRLGVIVEARIPIFVLTSHNFSYGCVSTKWIIETNVYLYFSSPTSCAKNQRLKPSSDAARRCRACIVLSDWSLEQIQRLWLVHTWCIST